MELNGVANMQMLIQAAVSRSTECHTEITPELADKLLKQLDLLNRYMVAYADSAKNACAEYGHPEELQPIKVPAWHEIKADLAKYPTLQEKVNGGTHE